MGSKFENEAGNITMKYYAILILTVWSCAEWGRVDGSSHPTSGPFAGQHSRPPPQVFNSPPPPPPAQQSSPPPPPRNPQESQPAVLETIPPASSPTEEPKLQRGVAHAKNMALWVDMVTNQNMVT